MLNFLISFLLFSFVCVAQNQNIDPGSSLLWRFAESPTVNGCAGPQGEPRFTRYNQNAPTTVTGIEFVTFYFENLLPNQLFISTCSVNCAIPTVNIPGVCVYSLSEVMFCGVANGTGHAAVNMYLPTFVSTTLMPPNVFTYFGLMQVISFSSYTNYSTSRPIIVSGLN